MILATRPYALPGVSPGWTSLEWIEPDRMNSVQERFDWTFFRLEPCGVILDRITLAWGGRLSAVEMSASGVNRKGH